MAVTLYRIVSGLCAGATIIVPDDTQTALIARASDLRRIGPADADLSNDWLLVLSRPSAETSRRKTSPDSARRRLRKDRASCRMVDPGFRLARHIGSSCQHVVSSKLRPITFTQWTSASSVLEQRYWSARTI